jgi:hypothetical protein
MSSSKVALLSGQTPWQDMSREELEREIEKAYYAVTQAVSALKQISNFGATILPSEAGNPYWGPQGIPARAQDACEEVMAPYRAKYEDPEFYFGYFRYAAPLLFETERDMSWAYCSACKTPWKRTNFDDTARMVGSECPTQGCSGIVEWLGWQHYTKKALPSQTA